MGLLCHEPYTKGGASDFIMEEAREIASIIGINIASEDIWFSLDHNNYVSFAGTYAYRKGWKKKAMEEYGKDIFTTKEKDHYLAKFFQEFYEMERSFQKRYFYSLYCDINRENNGIDIAYAKLDTNYGAERTTEEQEEMLYDLITLFCNYVLDFLKREDTGYIVTGKQIGRAHV